MMIASSQSECVKSAPKGRRALCAATVALLSLLISGVLSGVTWAQAPAAEPVKTDPAIEARVQTLIPDLEV